eukprot:comp20419_c0_seq1/m.40984 comp20419_c0_seq1/g.40984  ORF comp20419_c0_seq1/g.40984 comp20419_c0_seq1/m.40984 type:complete len:341 (-) comp20419_c0_seq1:47-1069(-)
MVASALEHSHGQAVTIAQTLQTKEHQPSTAQIPVHSPTTENATMVASEAQTLCARLVQTATIVVFAMALTLVLPRRMGSVKMGVLDPQAQLVCWEATSLIASNSIALSLPLSPFLVAMDASELTRSVMTETRTTAMGATSIVKWSMAGPVRLAQQQVFAIRGVEMGSSWQANHVMMEILCRVMDAAHHVFPRPDGYAPGRVPALAQNAKVGSSQPQTRVLANSVLLEPFQQVLALQRASLAELATILVHQVPPIPRHASLVKLDSFQDLVHPHARHVHLEITQLLKVRLVAKCVPLAVHVPQQLHCRHYVLQGSTLLLVQHHALHVHADKHRLRDHQHAH